MFGGFKPLWKDICLRQNRHNLGRFLNSESLWETKRTWSKDTDLPNVLRPSSIFFMIIGCSIATISRAAIRNWGADWPALPACGRGSWNASTWLEPSIILQELNHRQLKRADRSSRDNMWPSLPFSFAPRFVDSLLAFQLFWKTLWFQ